MTDKDLTLLFLKAQAMTSTWSEKRVRDTANLIVEICEGRLDWEAEVGEDWASILGKTKGQGRVAIIRSDFPLAIVFVPYINILRESLEKEGIVVVEAEDDHSPKYSIDKSKIPTIFPGLKWHTDVIDPQHMSINDLWWATI
ncbi:MAG TPA: hypothetical protein VKQ72_15045 [Aggregatilineales bacterium]|nr:hypothetical protein [Aggregatilineales bacterium]